MALSKEDLAQIAEIFNTTWDKKHQEFWIEAEQHFLDHQQLAECRQLKGEWIKNHEFVSEWRQSTETVKKVALRTAVGLVVAAFIGWIFIKLGWQIGK